VVSFSWLVLRNQKVIDLGSAPALSIPESVTRTQGRLQDPRNHQIFKKKRQPLFICHLLI
jgi:hypothetical protein